MNGVDGERRKPDMTPWGCPTLTTESNMAFKAKRNQTVAQKEIENGKALVDSALSGDLEGVQRLLDAGTSVDADDYNRSLFYKSQNYMTPLLCAASSGHVQVLRLLIDHGGT